MDYRRTSLAGDHRQQQHQQHQISAHAHIYSSFAGSGRTAHGLLPDSMTMWWDEERIEATVTRQFVLAQLRPDEAARLQQPLGFGDGLTDDTYWEWIEQKAKRIFLILVELGVPDQIFGVIDDSWDDDDLPVPLEQVERLKLTYNKDEKLERKFYQRQFAYLLRHIQKGEHLTYDDEEVVPLELAERRAVTVPVLTPSTVDKVHPPGRPDDVLVRRKIALGEGDDRLPVEEFLSGIEAMKVMEHPHLTSLWASYIHRDAGYLLLTPVNDSTLKSFLTVTPQSIKILPKQERRMLLLNWLHCLADALAFIHKQGLAHRNIRPSNVMLDVDNAIFLGDIGVFPTYSAEKRSFDKESYDYTAPEHARMRPTSASILAPLTHRSSIRRSTTRSTVPPSRISVSAADASTSSGSAERASVYANSASSNSTVSTHSQPSRHDPQRSDVFSLGAIFLEILTFFLKRTSRNFASHRSAKNKTPGRGGGIPDASFHQNLIQVESWMQTLAKDASKKEDKIFRGIKEIIFLVRDMMSPNPEDRPSARRVQERLYKILSENSGLGAAEGVASRIHCDVSAASANEWNFGFDELRLASQRAAAEACASVNPSETQVRAFSLGNGGVIYGIEKKEPVYQRAPSKDEGSVATKTSRSSDGKSKGSGGAGGKIKPKPKAWQAPVYSGISINS